MINVRPENAKLKVRARTIVERLASVGGEAAEAALVEAGSDVATAVVVAAGPLDAAAARRLLARMRRRPRRIAVAPSGARTNVNASAGMRPV